MTRITDLARITDGRSRSISPENFTGDKGAGGAATEGTGAHPARELGQGWKVSPSVDIPAGTGFTMAEISGPAVIRHIWLTTDAKNWRSMVLRMYWEHDEQPAVEVPLGDFFCQGWGEFAQVNSVPIAVNPKGGFNSYWEMPFTEHALLTLTNLGPEQARVYYQVDYELTEVPQGSGYLHAQWRRNNPLPYKEVHTVLEGVEGAGHYVGTYLATGTHNSEWWGEGEFKFYVDGDGEFPTICGTGTEDYFGGAWNFDLPGEGYTAYSTPYLGLPQILRPDGLYRSQQRFGMYRWHIPDPLRFSENLRITVQALGWRSLDRYLPLQDDMASTALFYLDRTSTHRPPEPDYDRMEVL
ncbi:glycoside hydrolase family 172 protein [Sciscionella sediminilitoris]|uniref:glycoside hydrolase family 172 protein n=1 Tax=Sciscionella sediminilitoris TaxID=1445613 RepID=UPI0004DF6773|nr:glycoside hydrolase family 172 protein [Sciscionella sp. SE31]